MAREIGVGKSTLMRVINPPYRFKAGSIPFENALWYCLTHEIKVNEIYNQYNASIDENDEQ